jgi:hypothetical protein
METTPRTIEIEIKLEELDDGAWRAVPAGAPDDASGSGRFRFTARTGHAGGASFVGSPFTMPRTSLAELDDNVETDLDARVRLGELDTALTTAGWRTAPDRGGSWWSLRYVKS